jgi:hypothetical protein
MIDMEKEISESWELSKASIKASAEDAGLEKSQLAILPKIFDTAFRSAYKSRFALRACTVRAKMAAEAKIKEFAPKSKLTF